jgi:hypothetical protein
LSKRGSRWMGAASACHMALMIASCPMRSTCLSNRAPHGRCVPQTVAMNRRRLVGCQASPEVPQHRAQILRLKHR